MSDEQRREERVLRITTGSLYPLLVKMAIPSMIGMIVSTAYNLTDTYFVGKLNDAVLTASVGVVFSSGGLDPDRWGNERDGPA